MILIVDVSRWKPTVCKEFYLRVKALEPDANAFCERAKKYELLAVPSDSFGMPGWFRLGYCVSYETIVNSLPAWKQLADEYRRK